MAPVLSLIAAMARNRAIGIENRLPWRLPEDLQYFKRVTMGKPVIMGRKTYESIGRPLPGRTNIVITRSCEWRAEGVVVAHSVQDALSRVGDVSEVFVIGGAELYGQALPQADRLYLTEIGTDFIGDAYFPEVDMCGWHEVKRESFPDDGRGFGYAFVQYHRC